ncbi:MAG: hypothetical protein PF542_03905 [Nanoarchaeota archaeon]|jgi:predicted nucleic acid-binding protein|nr:hypothetical protein [Nanoarchaeota archaeon]
MTENVLIFDAGPLIGLTMNGLLPELRKLKDIFPGKFIITEEVKYEVIDRPINIKRFELEALRIQELINDRILEFPESLGFSGTKITTQTTDLMAIANSTLFKKGKAVHLIDKGETSALVLARMLNTKGIKNLIAIDERTTRMLCEKPENLKKLLQKKLHSRIDIKKTNLEYFRGFRIIRSCELGYMMYKHGLLSIKSKKALDAVLYALKFKGCSISSEEINRLKKMA